MHLSDDLQMLDRISAVLLDACGKVDEASLGDPTPCPEWTVGDLLDHVSGGNCFTVNILAGATAADALHAAKESLRDPHEPIAAVRSSAQAQHDAFTEVGALARTCHHIAGDLSGEQVLRLRIHDVHIHTWDLYQGAAIKKGLDPAYVRWAINDLAQPDSLAARHLATQYPHPRKSYELLLAFGRRRNGN